MATMQKKKALAQPSHSFMREMDDSFYYTDATPGKTAAAPPKPAKPPSALPQRAPSNAAQALNIPAPPNKLSVEAPSAAKGNAAGNGTLPLRPLHKLTSLGDLPRVDSGMSDFDTSMYNLNVPLSPLSVVEGNRRASGSASNVSNPPAVHINAGDSFFGSNDSEKTDPISQLSEADFEELENEFGATSVLQLLDMGFPADHARVALKKCNGDIQRSIVFCVETSPESLTAMANELRSVAKPVASKPSVEKRGFLGNLLGGFRKSMYLNGGQQPARPPASNPQFAEQPRVSPTTSVRGPHEKARPQPTPTGRGNNALESEYNIVLDEDVLACADEALNNSSRVSTREAVNATSWSKSHSMNDAPPSASSSAEVFVRSGEVPFVQYAPQEMQRLVDSIPEEELNEFVHDHNESSNASDLANQEISEPNEQMIQSVLGGSVIIDTAAAVCEESCTNHCVVQHDGGVNSPFDVVELRIGEQIAEVVQEARHTQQHPLELVDQQHQVVQEGSSCSAGSVEVKPGTGNLQVLEIQEHLESVSSALDRIVQQSAVEKEDECAGEEPPDLRSRSQVWEPQETWENFPDPAPDVVEVDEESVAPISVTVATAVVTNPVVLKSNEAFDGERATRLVSGRLAAQELKVQQLQQLLEAERLETERLVAEQMEIERLAAQEIQTRRDAERLEAERLEAERLEAERLEAERLEAERLEAERLEAERLEAERLEAERLEAERLEAERLEAERLEAERLEAERLEAERMEAERLEAERIEAERMEAERLEAERLEAERLEAEQLELARLEAERVAAEEHRARLEAERLEAEHVEAERLGSESMEAERLEVESLEAERMEAERMEAERMEAERLEAERLEAEQLELARLEAERVAAEEHQARLEIERLERLETERVAALDLQAQQLRDRLEAEQLARISATSQLPTPTQPPSQVISAVSELLSSPSDPAFDLLLSSSLVSSPLKNRRQCLEYTVSAVNGKWRGTISLTQRLLKRNEKSPQGSRPDSLVLGLCPTRETCVDLCESVAPPVWRAKADFPSCTVCDVAFTMFNHAHHCRNCGHVVCNACSDRVWPGSMLPPTYHDGEKLVRVCHVCHLLMENFLFALKQGDARLALTLYASGNINLHNPLTVYQHHAYPIHCAASGGNVSLVRWLVDNKKCALVDRTSQRPLATSMGLTVFAVAAYKGHLDLMHFLVHQKRCSTTDISDPAILQRALHVALKAHGPLPPVDESTSPKSQANDLALCRSAPFPLAGDTLLMNAVAGAAFAKNIKPRPVGPACLRLVGQFLVRNSSPAPPSGHAQPPASPTTRPSPPSPVAAQAATQVAAPSTRAPSPVPPTQRTTLAVAAADAPVSTSVSAQSPVPAPVAARVQEPYSVRPSLMHRIVSIASADVVRAEAMSSSAVAYSSDADIPVETQAYLPDDIVFTVAAADAVAF